MVNLYMNKITRNRRFIKTFRFQPNFLWSELTYLLTYLLTPWSRVLREKL